jgi:uncharacterized protein
VDIIDFHTHAFPDKIAAQALAVLKEFGNISPCADGTLTGLIDSMDSAGVAVSVVASIATAPEQYGPIFDFASVPASDRIIHLPSVHPGDALLDEHLKEIKNAGFKGIKLHPYYQDFDIAEKRIRPLYELLIELDLFALVHTGYDRGYPRYRIADPERVRTVLKWYPDLKFVTSHFGGWMDWEEVERYLIGREIYLDISSSFEIMGLDMAKRFFLKHPSDFVLFGTDSPWGDPKGLIQAVRGMKLGADREEALFFKNAARLLALQ